MIDTNNRSRRMGAIYCSTERSGQMVQVLICDDDTAFLERIKTDLVASLEKMPIKYRIYAYADPAEISERVMEICDIAFLDVDFVGTDQSGMDIARRMRALHSRAVIIFVTNYIEYAPMGYEVRAFRYLLKQEVSKHLDNYLRLALESLKTEQKTFRIQINGEWIDLRVDSIVYIEAQRHRIDIHVQRPDKPEKIYNCLNSISSIGQRLETMGFLRVHKSFLVNMRHIRRYQCREVLLKDGRILSASVRSYREQKEKYLRWMERD